MHVSQMWTTEPRLGSLELHALTQLLLCCPPPWLANCYALDAALFLPGSLLLVLPDCALFSRPTSLHTGSWGCWSKVLERA